MEWFVNVLIRCDGSVRIGLGHIVRCLALADELHYIHNCHITFAVRKGPLGIKLVEEKGYKVIIPQENDQSFDYREWLNECVRNVQAKAIILDVRDGLPRTVLDEMRNKGILIITIDDPEDKRLSADFAFYPPVPQVKRIDWTGFTGKLYVGWKWVILREEFFSTSCCVFHSPSSMPQSPSYSSPCPMPPAPCTKIPRILVVMGGSDSQGMTLKTIRALELLDEDFEAVVVLGAGFQHKKEFDNLLSDCKHHFNVRENVQNMAELMAQTDLAVASFGMTAYELAAMGVPAIYLCLTEDHAESASTFVEAGMAVCLGVAQQVAEDDIANIVRMALQKSEKLELTRNKAIRSIDGRGAEKIARLIFNLHEADSINT